MATDNVNPDILRNYLKPLKRDEKNEENIRDKYNTHGKDLVDLVFDQNKSVLVESSNAYDNFNNLKEQGQNCIVKLEAILEQVQDLKAGSGGGTSYGGNIEGDYLSTTYGEFDKKIAELDKYIVTCNNNIETEKKKKGINSDKIKDTKEYLTKFVMEKRLYLDKVDEIALREKSKFF